MGILKQKRKYFIQRTYAFICSLCIVGICYPQSISVSSFKLLESDLTANTTGTMEQDQNGETAALIKVVTTQVGFTFDGGALGIVKTKQTPGEVWVYVPRGSKKITIKHPQLGVLRDYYYPIAIEAARTYEMILITGTVQTVVKQSANSQYLVLKVSPNNAIVELGNEVLTNSNGIAQKFVKLGTYDYRVQAPNYHTAAGKVTVDDPDNKKVVEINLLPAFGWVELLGNEENQGAQVYIDNALVGTVPFKSQDLPSGEHHIRVVKPMYDSYSQAINITDNKTTQLTPQLKADFSVVTINVDNNADIYVNEEKKGTGSWTGNLASGTYIMEAKKDGHRSTLANIEVSANQKSQTVQLQSPVPIYGSLNITSTPSEADVYMDDLYVGQTPLFKSKLLVGTHQLKIKHLGYNDYVKEIEIKEGVDSVFCVELVEQKTEGNIKFIVNIQETDIYVDGIYIGKGNKEKVLSFGKHLIEARINSDVYLGYKEYVNINPLTRIVEINLETKYTFIELSFEPKLYPQEDILMDVDGRGFFICNNEKESVEVTTGKHKITIKHKGVKTFSKKIDANSHNRLFKVSFKDRTIEPSTMLLIR